MQPNKADVMKAVNKKRREFFTLQRHNLVSDGRGGFKPGPEGEWVTVATAWVEPRKPALSTEIVAGAVSSVMTREWEMNYFADVEKGWRALWGNEILPIIHAYSYGHETTILVCREVVK